ncbi:MAG: cytochrome c-type biogenesis protein CcmH [Pseudomonadota bacterium]|nr:cytochrome c-type biogenesis protein CcmH [Pseudomonadota bacterium]
MKPMLILLLLLAAAAEAGIATYRFDDPADLARFDRLSAELRCLVCQNQNLTDSNAELAADLRREIRDMILAGRTDAQIIDFMTARYGDFVLYRPPLRPATWLLWAGPFLLLVVGAALVARIVRRRAAPPPLTPAEQARLREVLDDATERADRP